MIQRVIAIKNVGRFKNCAASGDVTFRKYTLIFAENARGKTTLCDILRSLYTNNPDIVIGRKTLGATNEPEVQLLLPSGPIAFRSGRWNAVYTDIAVFDSAYVRDNVYAGDSIDTQHRRNLYRVIIGAEGVRLAGVLDVIDGVIKEKTANIRDIRSQIQRYLARNMSVENFIDLQEDPNIEEKIAAIEQELLSIRQAAQLQQKTALAVLNIPVFPAGFSTVIGRTFSGIAANAEQRVGEHIAKHRMQARGEAWISTGLGYIAEEACPFCDQSITGSELIKSFQDFFSREYHGLREEVNAMKGQVEAAIGQRVEASLTQAIQRNAEIAESWRPYCAVITPTFEDIPSLAEAVNKLSSTAQALLSERLPHL